MRALVRDTEGLSLQDVPEPSVHQEDDVRIEVVWAGLCRTDLYAAQGKIPVAHPRILGHEFSGRVVEAGPASGLSIGDPVACMPLIGCGQCPACAERRPERCLQTGLLGVARDGAFAEQICLPARALNKLSPDFDLQRAAYAEPVAAALGTLEAGLFPEQSGAVVGEGRIAELTYRIMTRAGFRPVRCPSVEGLRQLNHLDYVVECHAEAQLYEAAIDALNPGGTLVLKSRSAEAVVMPISKCVAKQIRLQGVAYGPFESALACLADPGFAIQDLFGASYPLHEYAAMFAAADRGEAHKLFFRLSD